MPLHALLRDTSIADYGRPKYHRRKQREQRQPVATMVKMVESRRERKDGTVPRYSPLAHSVYGIDHSLDVFLGPAAGFGSD